MEASYDLSRRPLLLYDHGQAYRKLGAHELSLHSGARGAEAREEAGVEARVG